jgi:PAS domain S-box-containing protein
MLKTLFGWLSLLLFIHTSVLASQSETDGIAKLSAISLYNMDRQALKGNLKAYMYTNAGIKALKVIEALSGEAYIELQKNDSDVIMDAPLPKHLAGFDFFQSDVIYNGEKVGKVFAYYDAKNSLLNAEERQYLEKNSVITVGTLDYWAPYNFYEFGQPKGYSIELMNLVAQKVGMKINYIPASNVSELLSMVKSNEIHAALGLSKTSQREQFMGFTDIYINAPNAMMVRSDTASIHKVEDLKGKTLALTKSTYFVDHFANKYPEVKLLLLENELASLKAVSEKKADAVISSLYTMQYTIEKNDIPNLKHIVIQSEGLMNAIPLRMGVQKEASLLLSIFEKGLAAISEDEMKAMKEHWFNTSMQNTILELTNQEVQWLSKKQKIRFVVDPNWLPIEKINEKTGKYEGIAAEIISHISQVSGLEFELVPTKNFSESATLLKEGKVDMIASVSKTTERENAFTLSEPLFSLSNIVLMRSNDKELQELSELNGKKVGVGEGTSLHQMLIKKYPNIIAVPVKTIPLGLEKLSQGEIDAYLNSLEVASHQINALGIFNLKVVLKLDEKRILHSAFQKSLPNEVVSIFNKALKTISDEELEQIRNKWIGAQAKVDYTLIWQLVLGAFIVGLILFYFNYQLKRSVTEKTAELSALLSSFNTYVISSKTDLKGIITHASDAFCKISGYSKEELIGKSHHLLRHPDMPKSLFEDLWKTLKLGNVWKGEIKNRTKEGGYYWVDAIIAPEYNNKGKHVGYNAIRQDITSKKAVEDLSHTQTNQLREIERFQALSVGREARMVELKNMVNSVYQEQNKPLPFNIDIEIEIAKDKEFEIQLADVLDIKSLQELLDSFCDSIEIASAIIDVKGNILAAARWQKACTDFHRVGEQSCKNCTESDTELGTKLEDGQEFIMYKCKNGLVDCASPIIIDGKHLANVFVGQFLVEKPNMHYFEFQAERFGYDKVNYIKAIKDVPIFNEDKLQDIIGFLNKLTKLITALSIERIKSQKSKITSEQTKLAALNLAEDANVAKSELEKHKDHLEELILERTKELALNQEQMIYVSQFANLGF